jgi:hypothetical protein
MPMTVPSHDPGIFRECAAILAEADPLLVATSAVMPPE